MSDPGPVVTDSGPLIALATVGQMDLLGKVFGTILVPDAVFREVAWYGARRPGADELAAATWAIRVDLEVPPEALLAEDVGPGESEAIALAVQRRARLLLLDDRRARRIAEVAYHLRVKGRRRPGRGEKTRIDCLCREPSCPHSRPRYYIAQPIIDRAVREAGEA